MAQSFADPYVELRFSPDEVTELTHTGKLLGHPQEALESALTSLRLMIINRMKQELPSMPVVDALALMRIADLAWQIYLPKFRKVSAPILAEVYMRTYKTATAGEVPAGVILALAEEHADRLGAYFHETSREALSSGFNTFVNRRLATAQAADHVLNAYGLTARQMSGYASLVLKAEATPVRSPGYQGLKERFLAYIGKSVRQRLKILTGQEIHNAEQQSNQIAWMWLQEHGQLSPAAEKVWLTAKDEKVCPVCGPLHGKKVPLSDQFEVKGIKVWVPGLHPNCRCRIQLIENKFTIVKALEGRERFDFNQKHPRDHDGQFARKPTKVKDSKDTAQFQALLDQMFKAPVERGELTPVPKLSMPARIQQIPPKLQMTPPKLDMAEATVSRLAPAAVQRLEVSARDRLTLHQNTAKMIMTRQQEQKRPPRKTVYRNYVELPKPVYAIVEPGMEFDPNNRVEITSDVFWTDDPEVAAGNAERRFHQLIDDRILAIAGDPEPVSLPVRDTSGVQRVVHGRVSYDDIVGAVTWAAYRDRLFEPRETENDGNASVTYYDIDQNAQWTQHYTYQELSQLLGVEPMEFEVAVMELWRGHDSSSGKGSTELIPGSRYGEMEVSTSGLYQADEDQITGFGRTVPVTFYTLDPVDAEDEEVWEE